MLGKLTVIANTQPGTSNQPYPIPPLPAFFPVNFDISAGEHEAELIGIHLETTFLWHNTIHGALCQLDGDLGDIASQVRAISKSLSRIEIAIGSICLAKQQQTVLIAAKVSNQIRTNNFMMAASPDKPVMPTVKEQTLTSVKEASILQGAAAAQGAVIGFVSGGLGSVIHWITETEVYKSVVKWIKDHVEAVLSSITSSVKSIMRGTSAAVGDPSPK